MNTMRNKTFFYLAFFLLVVILQEQMLSLLRVVEAGTGSSQLQLFAYIGLFLVSCAVVVKYPSRRDEISTSLCVSYLYAAGITFICGLIEDRLPPSAYVLILVVPLCYLSFKRLCARIDKTTFTIATLLGLAVLLYVYWFTYSRYVVIVNVTKDYYVFGNSYILLIFIPLLLCLPNKMIRWICVSICALCLIASFKRTGTIALLLGLFTYFLLQSNGKQSIKRIATIILFVSVAVISVYHVNNYFGNLLFERYDSIVDDQGSGRLEVYEMTYKMIVNSAPLELIFGHGWNAVKDFSSLGLSAHIDLLEILYDFGVIGFGIYLYFLYRLILLLNRLIKRRSMYAGAFACSLVIFFVLSAFSHVYIYPVNMLLFVLSWAAFKNLDYCSYESRNPRI